MEVGLAVLAPQQLDEFLLECLMMLLRGHEV
jgi:hypothetical protein